MSGTVAGGPPSEQDPLSAGGSRRGSRLVAAGILLSRVSGLVRERALGHYLGTSAAADAFTAAFRIPNLMQHLMGEGVLSASFIPVYSRLLAQGRHEEAGRVAGAIAGLIAATAAVVTVLGILLAEPLTLLVAPGFRSRPETFDLTVDLVRILFPAVGFLVLSAWCLGVLNSHRRFFLSYVAPVVMNMVQIAVLVGVGAAVFGPGVDIESAQQSLVLWLAAGTVVGGALQFLIQLPGVLRLSRGLRPSLRTDLPGVRATLRTFVPVVTGRGVVQLSNYVQVVLGSFLAVGALAQLRYAQILYALPISLFGVAVAAAELPELASATPADRAAVAARLQAGLAHIAVFVLPTVVAYLVVGDLLVGAVFQTGAFGRLDALAVWVVLAAYTLGLLASTSSRLLQSALYGSGDARTPARVAVLRVFVSSALGAVLMVQLDRFAVTPDGVTLLGDLPAFGLLPEAARTAEGAGDLLRLGAAGLALAAGVAAWIEYGLLRRAVRRQVVPTTLAGGQLRLLLVAATVAGVCGAAVRPIATDLPPLLGGVLAGAVVAAAYLTVAALCGVPEVRDIVVALRRRLPGRLRPR